jgi:hypothetical protein
MAALNKTQRLKLGQYAGLVRGELIPLNTRACYFCAPQTLSEEDVREYLTEPVAALPPSVASRLPRLEIFLVPYLEKGAEPGNRVRTAPAEPVVATDKPSEERALSSGFVLTGHQAVMAFAVKDAEVADYHYRFYRTIAELMAGPGGANVPEEYIALIGDELEHSAHGEGEEESWQAKLELTARYRVVRRPTKRLKNYLSHSFVDTLTLYLHGICCDIDVEGGPRQIASHLLRKRLRLLRATFPAPEGYAVLPEDLKGR